MDGLETILKITSSKTFSSFLRGACGLSPRFPASSVHRSAGLLRTNGAKLCQSDGVGGTGLGLYSTYSLLNHSCVPNTRWAGRDSGSLSCWMVHSKSNPSNFSNFTSSSSF